MFDIRRNEDVWGNDGVPRYTTSSEPKRGLGDGWTFFLKPVWYGTCAALALAELEMMAADHELHGLRVEWHADGTFTTYGYLEALAA